MFASDGSKRTEGAITAYTWERFLTAGDEAHNPDARDFRLETIGRAFTSSILTDLGDGLYVGMVPEPKEGRTVYFVEMTISGPVSYPYKFTTEVGVTPDRLPFGPPRR